MEKIAYTIEPPVRPTQAAWFAEFKIGLMAKPRRNDRPKKMMEGYNFTNISKKLKP